MMPVSSAPLATATSAMALKSWDGTPPAARTTSSSGPSEPASLSVDTDAAAAAPTRRYTTPAVISAPKSALGYECRGSRVSSATLTDVSNPTNE